MVLLRESSSRERSGPVLCILYLVNGLGNLSTGLPDPSPCLGPLLSCGKDPPGGLCPRPEAGTCPASGG